MYLHVASCSENRQLMLLLTVTTDFISIKSVAPIFRDPHTHIPPPSPHTIHIIFDRALAIKRPMRGSLSVLAPKNKKTTTINGERKLANNSEMSLIVRLVLRTTSSTCNVHLPRKSHHRKSRSWAECDGDASDRIRNRHISAWLM